MDACRTASFGEIQVKNTGEIHSILDGLPNIFTKIEEIVLGHWRNEKYISPNISFSLKNLSTGI